MSGRLNIFQRTMLRWDEIHPYNAAHVIRLTVPLDLPGLRDAIRRTLAASGLGKLAITANERSFDYKPDAGEVELKSLEPGPEPFRTVTDEIERQLNTRFERREEFLPVRFFVTPEATGFFLGLIYFHPAADGEAAVHLLRHLAQCYLGTGAVAPALVLYPPRHDRWFRQPPGLLLRKFASLWRLLWNMRKSRRPRRTNRADAHNAVTFFSLTQVELGALARAGKTWNVSINDLFLALLLKALLRVAARQPAYTRRPWLSVGCIVNLRKDLGVDSPRTFGLFLGSFFITHRGGAEQGLAELAAEVRLETARIKRRRLYLGAPLEMAFARWWLGFLTPEQRVRFYPKHFPLWGGISNMNLNPLWPGGGEGAVQEYFRAVSTGPVTPLVFSITSFGRMTQVGVSWRREVYSAADIELVKSCFLEGVRELSNPV